MRTDFVNKLIGIWDNKNQAFNSPSKFAHIIVGIAPIANYAEDILLFQEQAYSYSQNQPYRVRALLVQDKGWYLEIVNYKIHQPERYFGGSKDLFKLENFEFDSLERVEGCNMSVFPVKKGYEGVIPKDRCNLFNPNQGKEIRLQSHLFLDKEGQFMETLDKGYNKHDQQIMGSRYGSFQFEKVRNR